MPPRNFMSPEELAEYLGISLASVYGWRHKGTGPRAIKIGRHVRFRTSDIEAWLENRTEQTPAAR